MFSPALSRRRVAAVALGNAAMLAVLDVGGLPAAADARRDAGETVMAVAVAVDGRLAGLVAVADQLKPTSAAAIAALHRLEYRNGDGRQRADGAGRRRGRRHRHGHRRGRGDRERGVTLLKGDLGGIVRAPQLA